MKVRLHWKGLHLEVERAGRICCTRGEVENAREGLEYLLDAVWVVADLLKKIMISKQRSTLFVK
jgi:hypothetical protein